MRTQTTAQSNALAAVRRREFLRVRTIDPNGAIVDLTALGGHNWVSGVDLDTSIDQPIDGATIRLRRDHGTLSLSPLRTDSTLNRDSSAAYAPMLDVARWIAVEVAVLDPAVATTPAAGDWMRVFEGSIDSIDPGGDTIVVQARDLGARLADSWLNEPTAVIVSGAASQPIETVIQTLLDTALGPGVVTLYTPTSPLYAVTRFGYQREPVMDAIQRLVESIGWACRYRWDAGTSSYRFTLYNPPRTKTTPDATLGPNRYRALRSFAISRAQVRNTVRIYFSTAIGERRTIFVNDAASQARYGTRPLIIEEASDSSISSDAEATTMANALLADLKDPKATGECDLPLYWPVELDDLIRFPTNGVHFDTNQDLAVVGIQHSLSPTDPSSTRLTLRGAPAGAYRSWLRRGGPPIQGGGRDAQVAPPICWFEALSQSKIAEDVTLHGSPAPNAPQSPFQWRTRETVNGAVGAWTAWSSAALPQTISVTRDPYYATQLEAEVLQADGQDGNTAWTVQGKLGAIDENSGDLVQNQAALSDFRRADTDASSTFSFTRGPLVAEVWAAYTIVTVPRTEADWDAVTALLAPLADGVNSFTVPRPGDQEEALAELVTYLADGSVGVVQRIVVSGLPQVPTYELDDLETATTGTQFVAFTERGIAITQVQGQTQIGANPISAFGAPTRGPGDTSLVRGGTLAAGQYEFDVSLDATRQSWIVVAYDLANGSRLVLPPFGFDRDKRPDLISVVPDATTPTKLTITGDSDTRSIGVYSTTRSCGYEVDGKFAVIDVALAGNLPGATNAGLPSGSTDTFLIRAFADPIVALSAAHVNVPSPDLCDEKQLSIYNSVGAGGSGAPAATWSVVQAYAPPDTGSTTAQISLKATATPAGWTVAVYISTDGSAPSTDETASLSPALSAPPSTQTAYDWTAPSASVPRSSTTRLVTMRVRAELLDSGGVVRDTRETSASWYAEVT